MTSNQNERSIATIKVVVLRRESSNQSSISVML